MITITPRQQTILSKLKQQNTASFSELFTTLEASNSERTLKRDLSELVEQGILVTQGGGRSLVYTLPLSGRFFIPLDALEYTNEEPDRRSGALQNYQFALWESWPKSLFSKNELAHLTHTTSAYLERVIKQTPDIRAKELERFIIELSWKSSKIEGNTYTLLDTELLLKEGIHSAKNSAEETTMILNHKIAFEFILEQTTHGIPTITRGLVEQVHALLMDGLISDIGLRKHAVGITGSVYRPIDNQFQIVEELETCLAKVNSMSTGFDKALTALLGISYLQPFVDGNKRTARLITNAVLITNNLAPLSYRNVDEVNYRASLLAFYEQLTILPMKQIFDEQYLFATENYA